MLLLAIGCADVGGIDAGGDDVAVLSYGDDEAANEPVEGVFFLEVETLEDEEQWLVEGVKAAATETLLANGVELYDATSTLRPLDDQNFGIRVTVGLTQASKEELDSAYEGEADGLLEGNPEKVGSAFVRVVAVRKLSEPSSDGSSPLIVVRERIDQQLFRASNEEYVLSIVTSSVAKLLADLATELDIRTWPSKAKSWRPLDYRSKSFADSRIELDETDDARMRKNLGNLGRLRDLKVLIHGGEFPEGDSVELDHDVPVVRSIHQWLELTRLPAADTHFALEETLDLRLEFWLVPHIAGEARTVLGKLTAYDKGQLVWWEVKALSQHDNVVDDSREVGLHLLGRLACAYQFVHWPDEHQWKAVDILRWNPEELPLFTQAAGGRQPCSLRFPEDAARLR